MLISKKILSLIRARENTYIASNCYGQWTNIPQGSQFNIIREENNYQTDTARFNSSDEIMR